eukprot:8103976-Pyramimonas_sp.AAC.1
MQEGVNASGVGSYPGVLSDGNHCNLLQLYHFTDLADKEPVGPSLGNTYNSDSSPPRFGVLLGLNCLRSKSEMPVVSVSDRVFAGGVGKHVNGKWH